MFRPFQKTDPLYYVGLIFMIFPLGGVAWFGYPTWTLIPSTLFTLAYILIIHIKDAYRKTIAILWFYLLFYIIFMSTQIEGSMMWFFFYLGNLLAYRFEDSWTDYRFISFLIGLIGTSLVGFFLVEQPAGKLFCLAITIFILIILYFQRKNVEEERIQQKIYQQNETINLLAAENERNRIGRDLHDSLGHTFAMMTLKTELALKQLDKENLVAVQKELEELKQISKDSMKEVRQLINNLKYRTVAEELDNIQNMFALSDIELGRGRHGLFPLPGCRGARRAGCPVLGGRDGSLSRSGPGRSTRGGAERGWRRWAGAGAGGWLRVGEPTSGPVPPGL